MTHDDENINQGEDDDLNKVPVPNINPMVKVFEAENAADGSPQWTIYNPVNNEYFLLTWAQFECLSRFQVYGDVKSLVEAVNKKTTIDITPEDVIELIKFLSMKGLIDGDSTYAKAADKQKQAQSVFSKMVHKYLFLTIPLVQPQKFLEATFPIVKPLFTKAAFVFFLILLSIGVMMTIPRAEEFISTFPDLISFEGLALFFISMFLIKAIHEMAHAYTATMHGVPVPHMGVAMIVMYPVLYTEATGSWRLKNRWQRLEIGIAGVLAELYISAIFLILWNIALPGTFQTLCFTMVTISMIGTVLVNMNPLMKFDGYYVVSDFLGIENMQTRATDFARWRIREILFGFKDPQPEILSKQQSRFLTYFGMALLIYRFFLFLGIAILVYYVFFKPLGFVLMMVELFWFIVKPVWGEIKVWWARRADIVGRRRSILTACVFGIFLSFFLIPVQHAVSIPAVRHAQNYFTAYPAAPSYIEMLNISGGQTVQKGEILAILSSAELDQQIKIEKSRASALKKLLGRVRFAGATNEEKAELQDQISSAEIQIENLNRKREQLKIRAPFSGTIVDFSPQIQEGRYVNTNTFLFRLIDPSKIQFTGYISEQNLKYVKSHAKGVFISHSTPLKSENVEIKLLSDLNTNELIWPELSSLHKGEIPAEIDKRSDGQQVIKSLNSIYTIEFKSENNIALDLGTLEKGTILIEGQRRSAFLTFLNRFLSLAIREMGFN